MKGIAGEQGKTGKSAYELAVENGFEGDLAAWLTSLHGKDGATGAAGADGKSAFALYKEANPEYTGTLEEWLASLVGAQGEKGEAGETGADGKSAYELACDNGYQGTVQEWLLSLKGSNGKSAYELAVEMGFAGTQEDWLASLKGEKGEKGEAGKGIEKAEIVNGNLVLTYTDGTQDTLPIKNDSSSSGETPEDYFVYSLTLQGPDQASYGGGRWAKGLVFRGANLYYYSVRA